MTLEIPPDIQRGLDRLPAGMADEFVALCERLQAGTLKSDREGVRRLAEISRAAMGAASSSGARVGRATDSRSGRPLSLATIISDSCRDDGFQLFKCPAPREIPAAAADFGVQLSQAGIVFAPHERTLLTYRAQNADVALACQPGAAGDPRTGARHMLVELLVEERAVGALMMTRFWVGSKAGGGIELGPLDGSLEEYDEDVAKGATQTLYATLGLLSSGMATVSRVVPDEKLRRARARKGKPGPIEHNVVTVRPSARADHVAESSGQPARRLHWRRGHVRRYQSGRIAVVRPHLVGSRELGEVVHDAYDLRNMVQLLGETPTLEQFNEGNEA